MRISMMFPATSQRLSKSAAVGAMCLIFATPAAAQEGDRGPFGERMFMYMDRDRNGSLDTREIEQMPGPMREWLQSSGRDGSRPISREDFLRSAPQMMAQFRGGPGGERDRDGSDRGRGGYGGSDRGRGGFEYDRYRSGGDGDRGGGDRSDGDRDRGPFGGFRFGGGGFTMRMSSGSDRRSESDRDSRSGSSKSSSESSRQRVTLDLPAEYQERDLDLDGQIGQYEWMLNSSRAGLAEFLELDANGDGFLTPRELAAAKESGSDRAVQANARNGGSRLVIVRSGDSTASNGGDSAAASDPATRQAETYFSYLDRDKDGKLVPEEWETSRRLRPMFEQAGIDLSKPMSREQFIQHSVRLSQNN